MSDWVNSAFSNVKVDMYPPTKRKKVSSRDRTKCKSKDGTSILKKNIVTPSETSVNWIDNFSPQTEADLAVHVKKIQEVKEWINKAMLSSRKRSILLLTGPTGSGKTATVRVLCKDLGLTLNEWVTPLETERFASYGLNQNLDYYTVDKQSDVFLDFLLKASRYNSLFENYSKGRIVLVEDFPNYLLRNSGAIEDVLSKYSQWGKSPLIFICTEAVGKEVNIARNIFTEIIRQEFHIDHISFNPVSTTGLRNALKRACGMMSASSVQNYKLQEKDMIEAIVYSSIGDIRSALNNLRFSCLKEAHNLQLEPVIELQPWTMKTPRGSTKSHQGKRQGNKLVTMGKDDTLGLLHGVGRVLNPKRVVTTHGYTFSHPIQNTVESFLTMSKIFVSFLHQNYLAHFNCIDDIAPAVDCISLADVFNIEWASNEIAEYALWLAIGGLQIHNLEPVKLWAPVRAPVKIDSKIANHTELCLDIQHLTHRQSIATDLTTYCKIIRTSLNEEVIIEEEDEEIIIES